MAYRPKEGELPFACAKCHAVKHVALAKVLANKGSTCPTCGHQSQTTKEFLDFFKDGPEDDYYSCLSAICRRVDGHLCKREPLPTSFLGRPDPFMHSTAAYTC